MKVEWTEPAKVRLREIFDYYNEVAGIRTARKIVGGIVECTHILVTHPRAGAREQLLTDQQEEHLPIGRGKLQNNLCR